MTLVAADIPMPGDAAIGMAFGSAWLRPMTLTFSGSYVTGGDAWDPLVAWPGESPSTVITITVNGGDGFDFAYDRVNKKLKVYSASNTELAAGAYPAGLTGDTNTIALVFAK
jgi:hypothetical protein